MLTRREFLRRGGAVGAALYLSPRLAGDVFAAPSGGLDPAWIAKYASPLVVPPAMPRTPKNRLPSGLPKNVDYYEIAVRQFEQQILPPGMPSTTVWGHGSVNHPGTFNYPSFTLEAKTDKPVRVKWINGLVDSNGDFLPHLLPVDPTLHWANPPGGDDGRDMRPTFETTPGAYLGPVPMVTHLHGGHNTEESDGYAEAWYLPAARNIPPELAKVGSYYDTFKEKFEGIWRQPWDPGTAVFQYENDQRAATLWFHDHVLGMTRLNVYAGPAGFYLVRGGPTDLENALPGPAPRLGDPPGTRYYEIPIVVQDRSFSDDGSLSYPSSREFFDGFAGPYIPSSDISPIWNPEFFGNTMVTNGRTWPLLEVEPRRYRFRLMNGCNSRFVILKIVADPLAERPAEPAIAFWQIGTEGGFLPTSVQLDWLLMSPAERADVVVDFTGLTPGTELYLINEGPDEPFGGGVPGTDFPAADPRTTGQVLKLVVVPLASKDTSVPPDQLTLPRFTPLGVETETRKVSLNEDDSRVLEGVGPREALLGTMNDDGSPNPLDWDDDVTEHPDLNAVELWEIFNFTADAHPIHIHEVQFQVVDRQPFGGDARPPESWETGFKDMVISYPDEITRVKALFDLPGRYVWHCHIVEHEDNEMMRPFDVG